MAGINALLLFLKDYSVAFMFVVFVLLLATVLWPGRAARFEKDARIPLDDEIPLDDAAGRRPRKGA